MDLKDALNKRIPKKKIKAEYIKFRSDKNLAKKLYAEISKIVKKSDIYTIRSVVCKESFCLIGSRQTALLCY